MEPVKVIRENQTYLLTTGISAKTNDLCYQVINKEHGVVELESYILPQVLKYFGDLTVGLQAVLDIEQEGKVTEVKTSGDNIIRFN
jgi:hypothetical protein